MSPRPRGDGEAGRENPVSGLFVTELPPADTRRRNEQTALLVWGGFDYEHLR